MTQNIIFAMRAALLLATLAVMYAFILAFKDFVLTRRGAENWLATGVWILAAGATLTNVNNLVDFINGMPGAPSVVGLATLILGYFLCFSAWYAARYDLPIKIAAAIFACVMIAVGSAAYFYSMAML